MSIHGGWREWFVLGEDFVVGRYWRCVVWRKLNSIVWVGELLKAGERFVRRHDERLKSPQLVMLP